MLGTPVNTGFCGDAAPLPQHLARQASGGFELVEHQVLQAETPCCNAGELKQLLASVWTGEFGQGQLKCSASTIKCASHKPEKPPNLLCGAMQKGDCRQSATVSSHNSRDAASVAELPGSAC